MIWFMEIWKSGRVVEGSGLENRRTKVPWVRILPLPPFVGDSCEKHEMPCLQK